MATASQTNHLKLEVANFGPIAEASIELRPMTVFVGPSNTGKSYLATLIYALHQFFNPYAVSALGNRVSHHMIARRLRSASSLPDMALTVEDVDDVHSWISEQESAIQTDGQLIFTSDRGQRITELVRLALDSVLSMNEALDAEVARCFGVDKASGLEYFHVRGDAHHSMSGSITHMIDHDGVFTYKLQAIGQRIGIKASIPDAIPGQMMQSAETPWLLASSGGDREQRELDAQEHIATLAFTVLSHSVGQLGQAAYYLPAARAGVMITHQPLVRSLIAGASRPTAIDGSSSPALSGVYGDFLEGLVGLGNPTVLAERTEHSLPNRLEREVLSGEIRIESNTVGYPSFFYRPAGWQRDLPLLNASSAVSELAPVVLYLRHIVQPGDTLIIEEPETNLHPQAQVEFTRVLAAAVKAGIRIIITTHSEWVLEELANLVRMSELSPERREGLEAADFALTADEVGAWFFDPNGENGGSVVREIPLDVDSGTFPSGFGLVTEDLYNRWVEITSRVENG